MENASLSHIPPSTLNDLAALSLKLKASIPAQEDAAILGRPLPFAGKTIPNRMAIHPMEGCDATADGAPDELTWRRAGRIGAGGAGLLWFEASAILPEARANPRQLWLHEGNKGEFRKLLELGRRKAQETMGDAHHPFCVLQITHSGRYSRPVGPARPIIAQHNPHLDPAHKLAPDYPLITDDELEQVEDAFVAAARRAFEVGFDAVDVKSCHRYLISELLGAHTRPGKYGGSYENRTRFLKNVIGKIQSELGRDRLVTPRLSIYDGIPYPHGWGMAADGSLQPDYTEPMRLARELAEMGVRMLNVTMGNPYHNPHVNRPFGRPVEGIAPSPEHPLLGVARMMDGTRQIRQAAPGMTLVGSGVSWLRNLWPNAAAAEITAGTMDLIGLGRQAFAWPDFAREILRTGRLDRRHTCIACAGCTYLMRHGRPCGCIVLDKEIYGKLYNECRTAG